MTQGHSLKLAKRT